MSGVQQDRRLQYEFSVKKPHLEGHYHNACRNEQNAALEICWLNLHHTADMKFAAWGIVNIIVCGCVFCSSERVNKSQVDTLTIRLCSSFQILKTSLVVRSMPSRRVLWPSLWSKFVLWKKNGNERRRSTSEVGGDYVSVRKRHFLSI